MRYLQQLVIRIGLEIMRAFFEHLKKKNILSRSGVDKRSIEKLSKMKIIDLSEQLLDICSSVEEKRQPTTFKHFSSLSLGGGIEECASLECRLKKIDQLARFAVLYSNKVYIRNFLGDYEHLKNEPKIELLERLFNDLCIIWYIRPLIEKGHISLLSPIKHMCPYCFVEHYRLEPTLGGRLIRVQRKLAQQYLANTSLNIVKLGDKYGIEARGPETLYEHGFAGVILRKLPECLKRRTRLLEKL